MRQRNADLNANRRAAILDAAATCFVKNGFHATTMKDVCDAVGMSPGTLYHYFRSKAEVITAIVARDSEITTAALQELGASNDIFDALYGLLDLIAGEVTDDELALHGEISAEVLRNAALRDQQRISQQSDQMQITKMIEKAQALGTIDRTLDPANSAALILMLVDGMLWRATLGGMATVQPQLPAMKQALARILLAPEQLR